jgi:hypothetical protein
MGMGPLSPAETTGTAGRPTAAPEHLDTFLAQAESAGARVRAFVEREFADHVKCGILSRGLPGSGVARSGTKDNDPPNEELAVEMAGLRRLPSSG